MLSFILTGLTLGASAALSPGPLQTLVISATLKHNYKEGIKIAFAPLLTDAPIIFISVFILSRLTDFNWILGSISLGGGCFLIYLGCENIRGSQVRTASQDAQPKSIQKAVITNFLSPNPYIFWFTVGAPTFVNATQESWISGVLFIGFFYMVLVTTFIATAFLCSRFRNILTGKGYLTAMRILGAILILFSILFFKNGLHYFGWL